MIENCPFCGKPAHWIERKKGGRDGMFEAPERALGCDNPDCPIKPTTPFLDTEYFTPGKGYRPVNHDETHLAAWNTRR